MGDHGWLANMLVQQLWFDSWLANMLVQQLWFDSWLRQCAGLFQLFWINTCTDSSWSVLPLCAQHVLGLLWKLKNLCAPSDMRRPNNQRHANTEITHNSKWWLRLLLMEEEGAISLTTHKRKHFCDNIFLINASLRNPLKVSMYFQKQICKFTLSPPPPLQVLHIYHVYIT